MTATVGEILNFAIPTNTCTDADGDAITYSITEIQNGSGLTLVNGNSIQWKYWTLKNFAIETKYYNPCFKGENSN